MFTVNFTSGNVVSGEGITSFIKVEVLFVDLVMKLEISLSYNRGLIIELMGKITIENKAYQSIASITSRV